jgi:hypothetical protein
MAYNIENNVKKTVYSDICEVANSNVAWDKLKNKTVFITGAGGFIGYYFVLSLLARNDLYNDGIKENNFENAYYLASLIFDNNDDILSFLKQYSHIDGKFLVKENQKKKIRI